MNARFQIRIQRYGWDKACEHYETGWKNSLAPAQEKLLDLCDVQSGENVLDLACGTGLVTLPLADAVGSSGRVVATDLSDRMVEHTQSLCHARGLNHVTALRADAEDLSAFDDATFDVVTCALGLMYCPNPAAALSESFRVLKPGGRAVFAVWGTRKNCRWAEIFPIVDARVHSSVCPMFFHLGTSDILATEMKQAGFATIETERILCDLPYPDAKTAIDAAFIGGPVALAYSRFDQTTRAEVRLEYLDSISDYKHDSGYKIPGEFVVNYGTKPNL
ncbi:MAG: class I SAM-dependent methyltransferase [Pseudomonadota bacterium]